MILADNQKYYYLKLKDNFFDTDEMIVLESMPDGYLYSNILLKLYLRSLKYNGRLMFNERIPFNSTMLAQVTRHNVGVIEKAMQIFQELGLVEILDNGAIYLSDIQNFIGKSTTEADRIRSYRKKIESEKAGVQKLYKCTPEIEIELEPEIKKDIDLYSCAAPQSDTPPETVIKFPTNRKGEYFCVTVEHAKMFEAGYPAVDVKQELNKMLLWFECNPTRKKTKNGMMKFIYNWLGKAQNSAKKESADIMHFNLYED